MEQQKSRAPSSFDQYLDEECIKILVLRELFRLKCITTSAIIATEYPLGRLGVRADLAIYDRSFIGVEIKSAHDGIRRLKRQIEAYAKLFDKTILVLATKHVVNLRSQLPPGVEVWEISRSGRIKKVQRAPIADSEGFTYLKFMTKMEVKRFVLARAAVNATIDPRAAFLAAFHSKFRHSSKEFWCASVNGIDIQSVSLLSRFRSRRERAQKRLEAKEERWGQWLEILMQSKPSSHQSFHASSVSYSPESSP